MSLCMLETGCRRTDVRDFEVSIPAAWVDKSVGELDIRKSYQINIMAIKHDGKMNMNITPGTILRGDNTMLVLGSMRDIQKCFKL